MRYERRLVVIRHSKSSYPDGVADHDRPLAPRGVEDARAMGAWLATNVGTPDHVVVSTARRTRGTWTLAAESVGYIGAADYDTTSPGPLVIDPRVYEANTDTLLTVLRETPDRARVAFLVGHNPGCEDLVASLAASADPHAAKVIAAKYPTSGVAVLDFNGPWGLLSSHSAHLSSFVAPRGTTD
jgi:phosphohistidine phosphatase